MKYIRTKEKIYEIDETCKRDNQILFFDNKERTQDYIIDFFEGKDVLKQADTIEEVCDMFVVWLEGRNMPIEMPLSEKEQYEKMKEVVLLGTKEKLNIWLKLAIWTDQGLIYVEKMNEKGELELI